MSSILYNTTMTEHKPTAEERAIQEAKNENSKYPIRLGVLKINLIDNKRLTIAKAETGGNIFVHIGIEDQDNSSVADQH